MAMEDVVFFVKLPSHTINTVCAYFKKKDKINEYITKCVK